MHRSLLASALTAMLPALAAAQPVAAATPDGADAGDARLLDSVQVTGVADASAQTAPTVRIGILGTTDPQRTPFSVKGYTDRLVRDQGALNFNEVAANDPTLRASLSPTFPLDQTSIRGFLVSGGSYLFDGLQGLAPQYGTMPVQFFERIDIIKGPTSGLVGTVGTVGGIVNFAPKRAGDVPVASVTTYARDASLLGAHVDLGQRFGAQRQWGARVNAAHEQGRLYDDSERRQTAAQAALDWRSERARVVLDVGHIHYEVEAPGINFTLAPGARVPTVPDPSKRVAAPWSVIDNRTGFALLSAEVDVSAGWTAYARAGRNQQQVDRLAPLLGPLSGDGSFDVTAISYDPWRNRKRVVETGLRGAFDTGSLRHQLVVSTLRQDGGQSYFGGVRTSFATPVRASLYDGIRIADPYPDGLPPDNIGEEQIRPVQASVAVADTVTALDDRLGVTLALRSQHIESGAYDQSATTPTAAVLYAFDERLSVYANYAQALSQGDVAPANAANANEQLAPYESKQMEAGAKWALGGFGVTFAAFDITQATAFLDPATNVFAANGEQRHRGVELEAFGEIRRGLRLLGGVAYIDAEQVRTRGGVTDGRRALGVPAFTANLGAEWDVPSAIGLTFTARYIHTGDAAVDVANTQIVDAWNRLDLGARLRPSNGPLTFRAGVDNVTDERYWATGGRNIIVVAAPRTWRASVSYDF